MFGELRVYGFGLSYYSVLVRLREQENKLNFEP